MKKYTFQVMHPGCTTYDSTIETSNNLEYNDSSYILTDDNGIMHYFPRIFTIITIKKMK